MRLGVSLVMAASVFGALCFIFAALQIIGKYEQRRYVSGCWQIIMLSGINIFTGALLYAVTPLHYYQNMCSMACLLVVAIIDEQTGYIYDCFGVGAVIICGVLALSQGFITLNSREMLIIGLYIMVICLAAALHGLGNGDVPVYLALLLYYLRYAVYPADAAICMLLASQMFFTVSALLHKKSKLPLVPYIYMAHLVTLCLWVF